MHSKVFWVPKIYWIKISLHSKIVWDLTFFFDKIFLGSNIFLIPFFTLNFLDLKFSWNYYSFGTKIFWPFILLFFFAKLSINFNFTLVGSWVNFNFPFSTHPPTDPTEKSTILVKRKRSKNDLITAFYLINSASTLNYAFKSSKSSKQDLSRVVPSSLRVKLPWRDPWSCL